MIGTVSDGRLVPVRGKQWYNIEQYSMQEDASGMPDFTTYRRLSRMTKSLDGTFGNRGSYSEFRSTRLSREQQRNLANVPVLPEPRGLV